MVAGAARRLAEVHRVHGVAIVHAIHVGVDAHVHVVAEIGLVCHLIAEERILRVGVESNISSVRSHNVAIVVVVFVHKMSKRVGCLKLLLRRLQSHRLAWLHLRDGLAGLNRE